MLDLAVSSRQNPLSGSRAGMAVRLGLGVVLALVVTVALLWAMRSLIETGDDTLARSEPFRSIDILRVEREPDPIRRTRLEPPPVLDPPPEIPSTNDFDPAVTTVIAIPAPQLPAAEAIEFSPTGFGNADGDITMVLAVSPGFPMGARIRGVEGYCTVQFTVTDTGSVRDPVVVQDQCTSSLFHRASLDAASKTKFKPRVIDGQPVDVPGWKIRYRFELSD